MATFIYPVAGARLTSPFGYRTIFGKKEWHQGIDLAKSGTVPIVASADGEVYRTGALGTYGNIVMIRHTVNGKRMDTVYAHLRDGSIKVKNGQKVKQGQQIALMGSTGRSTGQHLHFEVHNGKWATGQPNAVDPLKYIGKDVESSKSSPGSSTNLGLVDYLKSNGIDSSFANRSKLAAKHGVANYKGTASQNTELLERIIDASKPKPKAKVKSDLGLVDYLTAEGIDSSFANRKKLASKFGIAGYRGTAEQNTLLLSKIQADEKNSIYRIYTGTVKTKAEADAVEKRIRTKFPTMIMNIITTNGRYQIKTGTFTDKQWCQSVANTIKSLGYIANIVRDK